MRPQFILILSLVCNLTLGATAYHFLREKSPTKEAAVAGNKTGTEEAKTTRRKSAAGSESAEKVSVTNFTESEFTWHHVEAPEYKDYIANLRAIDCPEQTIRDIIIADVNKLYAGRMRELRGDTGVYRYWKDDSFNWDTKERYERQKKVRELEKEKRALLTELLGIDPIKEQMAQWGYEDYRERNFTFLAEEKKKLAIEIQEKFEERKQEIYRAGIYDEEDQKKLREIYQEQLAEMAKIMTPKELEEYDLRASQTASQLRYDLDQFEPTEEEFRAIYALRKAREEDLVTVRDPDDKEALERRKKASEELDAQVKNQLGEERFAEYKRAQDHNYRELTRLTERLELPKSAAVAVYEMKKTAEEQAKAIRADKNLSNEKRQEALKAIRAETEKEIAATLGESGLKKYQTRGGWWLNNLAPRSR